MHEWIEAHAEIVAPVNILLQSGFLHPLGQLSSDLTRTSLPTCYVWLKWKLYQKGWPISMLECLQGRSQIAQGPKMVIRSPLQRQSCHENLCTGPLWWANSDARSHPPRMANSTAMNLSPKQMRSKVHILSLKDALHLSIVWANGMAFQFPGAPSINRIGTRNQMNHSTSAATLNAVGMCLVAHTDENHVIPSFHIT